MVVPFSMVLYFDPHCISFKVSEAGPVLQPVQIRGMSKPAILKLHFWYIQLPYLCLVNFNTSVKVN